MDEWIRQNINTGVIVFEGFDTWRCEWKNTLEIYRTTVQQVSNIIAKSIREKMIQQSWEI